MISDLILKKFIGEDPDFENSQIREKTGYTAGLVGVIINSCLFVAKLIMGLALSSIALMADAFNNLSDAVSSIVTIVGFKLANLPPDKDHPYGHGRIEYIAGLLVAFMVMLVGLQFIKSSLARILNPRPVVYQTLPFFLLILSIGLKLWLSSFNKKLGRKIDSSALKASSTDALGDAITTSIVLISILGSKFTSLAIDGYLGLIVSIFIIYAGFSLVKETISPLIGEAAPEELLNDIKNSVLSYDYITGVHDLVVHNYGPGRTMASIHAEFPSSIDVMEIHQVIDQAERDIGRRLNITLVIHMDPLSMDSRELIEARAEVDSLIEDLAIVKSIHDFRIVGTGSRKNLIFDLVLDGNLLNKEITESMVKEKLIGRIRKENPGYSCIITIDKEYM